MNDYSENFIKMCIINGVQERYDLCSENRNPDLSILEKMVYLGSGRIHKVNGYTQEGSRTYHFWRHI
jgi:hypothetical protein